MSSWIEDHPDAPRIDRILALAKSLVGTAEEPYESTLEWYGLEEDFNITDEPMETCLQFDAIVMRCPQCDWWVASEELEETGFCEDCVGQEEAKEGEGGW